MAMVHIIMATYNGEKYLKRQLDSILQAKGEFCLHVFDDGSVDGTLPILAEYEKRYPKTVHVTKNAVNLGCAKNFLNALCTVRDQALALSQTPAYFMFCDQDDVWHPDKITLTLHAMKKMETKYGENCPIMVFTDAVVADEDARELAPSFIAMNHLNPRATGLSRILIENKCIGCTTMMNQALSKLLVEVPEHARYHDWWMALLASAFGHIAYVKHGTLQYCQHGGNSVGVQNFGVYLKNRLMNQKAQKKALIDTQRQAAEFLHRYGERFDSNQREILQSFSTLSEQSLLKRRRTILRYGFYKSGLIRNIGLLFIA